MKMPYSILVLLLWGLIACQAQHSPSGQGEPVSHEAWNLLLQTHVSPEGLVDYAGLQQDSLRLNAYVSSLGSNPPSPEWGESEQLAFWINAYNAFTVKLIVDNYPLSSIKDLNPTLSVPLVHSVWTKKFIDIAGEKISLDHIEHKILRKQFEEPRIHFAINCASASCPALLHEAYTAEKLESQLQAQALRFVNDPALNQLEGEKLRVSKIFFWFKGDFTKEGDLRDFLNIYALNPILEDVSIKYLPYDWTLNSVPDSGESPDSSESEIEEAPIGE